MSFEAWLVSSTTRIYPDTPLQPYCPRIESALNETHSIQVAVRLNSLSERTTITATIEPNKAFQVRVRRVGYVPIRHLNMLPNDDESDVEGRGHIPGFVPDPLFDERELLLPEQETHAFWLSITPTTNAEPGQHTLTITLTAADGTTRHCTIPITLYDVTINPRQGFDITNWFYVDSLFAYYGTDQFDERFWSILPAYLKNLAEHGQNVIYVPVFTPPLDGVKLPSQLLIVQETTPGQYVFDWRDVKRYVDLARACGLTKFEWTHFFTQWGAANAIRIYHGQGKDGNLLWPPETPATGTVYRNFLSQYLPELHAFLEREGLLAASLFHISDEPNEKDVANYRADRQLIHELAPWIKTCDATSHLEYGLEHLVDLPFPSTRAALDFLNAGIESGCYYCCGPRGRYINRLIDTPLTKIAMHGLLFYRWPFKGFLHWGYNYWFKRQTQELIDPYTIQDAHAWQDGWVYGDPFVVYPGPDGPVDSIRWEILGESLQDYCLLQTLGIDRDSELLKDITSFEEWPRDPNWCLLIRKTLLTQ